MYSIPVWRGPRGAMELEDRTRIDAAIEDGSFFSNDALARACEAAKADGAIDASNHMASMVESAPGPGALRSR